jgi:outer membrane receptor protein involved in Fe transport
MTKLALLVFSLFFMLPHFCAGQSRLSGIVLSSETNEPLAAASIRVKNGTTGTTSDARGNFELTATIPVTLIISYIGFETQEVNVDAPRHVSVYLKPASLLGQEIVVLATRIPIRIIESPVSIERIGSGNLRSMPVTSYYDAIGALKGVDLVTSSLNFKTPSTRGFNASGNVRFNQLVDGMDNHAVGLNFPVGAVAGLTELDVERMELLPGSSSALYGTGGTNGTLLITSKNPFRYPGFSLQVKEGVMHVDGQHRSTVSSYHDLCLRWARVVGKRFAFKISGSYVEAKDWLADDSSNYVRSGSSGHGTAGSRTTDPNYDGVNVYGDETSVDIRPFLAGALPSNHPLLAKPLYVSRTGYAERDVLDPKTSNLKLSGALHYKFREKTEVELMGYRGQGNTIYTGSDRYSFRNIRIGQYKLEVRSGNWFARVYTTQSNAGETFNATVTSRIFNEYWKPSFNATNINGSWYPQYTGAFLTALQQGASVEAAHNAARSFADIGRPVPGSALFQELFNKVRRIPISAGGGLFIDRSSLWKAEGQYVFSREIKFAEVIAGASIKKYLLNSKGTIFIDSTGSIGVNETGAYVQVTKKLMKERLTVSGTGRYDKNENFKGRLTPRFAVLARVAKQHFFRVSYQEAYRLPTAVQQFMRLQAGNGAILMGGLPWINDYMHLKTNPVYEVAANGSVSTTAYVYKPYKPETSRSVELGYKVLLRNKWMIDAYGYRSSYEDFIGRILLYQPATGKTFVPHTNNANSKINTYGFGLEADYRMRSGFFLSFNIFSDRITGVPENFIPFFNTPDYRLNAGLGHPGLGKNKNWGFHVQYRWQDDYFYESDFTQGPVPAYGTIDAQISLQLKKLRSVIRAGGTNVLNHYYRNAFGNPYIGGLYYVGYAYNIF